MSLQKIEFEYDIPYGYRFVRYGLPKEGEHYMEKGKVMTAEYDYETEWPIVEKIPEQEQPTSQPELKLQYKTQQGDWRDVNDGYEYRIKPKTRIFRFRNYLATDNCAYSTRHDYPINFVKWLGDWQEVEIEENE